MEIVEIYAAGQVLSLREAHVASDLTGATPTNLGTFIDANGGVWPVVGYYDIKVEPTDDPDEIVWAMVGVEGHWMMIKLDEVDEVTIQ